jgi:hypothetical protein
MQPSAEPKVTLRAAEADVREVLAREARRCRAMEEGQLARLGEFLAEDLHYTHTSGRSEGKVSLLHGMVSGQVKYHRVRTMELEARAVAGAVTLQGVLDMDIARIDQRRAFRSFFKSVWSREAGDWQMLSWISTPLPHAPSEPSHPNR